MFRSAPLHNWASNGADAFRYAAMGMKRESSSQNEGDYPERADMDYDIFTHSQCN